MIKNYSSSILGSENTRSINIIKNTFKAPSSLSSSKTYRVAIFYEDEDSTNNFTINSKVLNIDSNIIEYTVRRFFLFGNGNKSKKELQIGTNTTEVINITNNKFHAKENSIIRINTENTVLNITTKKLNIINNEFISKVGDATFISNPNGKTNIGSNVTEEINIDNNKLEGPNVYLFSGSHINTKVINITNNNFKETSGESCLAFEGVKFSENVEVLNIYIKTHPKVIRLHILFMLGVV